MTSPNGPGNFEYNDDSVVARLSFEVPAQALNDANQLAQAIGAAATQQEYMSRSTGTWLDYMNQVPQIMERANQAYRDTITQLERMSYIQNELGGGGAGNVSPGATAGPQGGGYSTAAGAGYTNPFAGQFFGMGMTPDLMSAQQHLGQMASQDPRMYANMMAARGMAVNPAMMGQLGGQSTGGGQGMGNAAPGSMAPQPTQSQRDSSSPPDPVQRGQGKKAEPQDIPAEATEDAPAWQKSMVNNVKAAQTLMNETGAGGGGRGNNLFGMAAGGLTAAGKYLDSNPNAFGGALGGKAGKIAMGAGLAGVGAWGLNKIQDTGEMLQEYQRRGSVQGGGMGQGIEYEAQARVMALNPFITTQQARQAMQMALSAGFRGGDYDTIQDYMLSNFKDLGMQFSDSMAIARANVNNLEPGQDQGAAEQSSKDFLRTLKALSAEGGASLPSRVEQTKNTTEALVALGVPNESIQRGIQGLQEGYGDRPALRDSIGGIGDQVMKSPQLLQLAANANGINGLMPGALAAGLTDKGLDQDKILESAASQIAQYAQGFPERANRIAAFQQLMGQQGVELDWPQAENLYDKVTGDKKPSDQAAENTKKIAKPHPNILGGGNAWSAISGIFSDVFTHKDGKINLDHENMGDVFGNFNKRVQGIDIGESKTRDQFLARGNAAQAPPQTAQQAAATSVRTEGQVQGQVTITVDQQGRVSAPQSIQLSGQQKSANAGYGSAQLNNAPPGDPSFNHAYTAWGGSG